MEDYSVLRSEMCIWSNVSVIVQKNQMYFSKTELEFLSTASQGVAHLTLGVYMLFASLKQQQKPLKVLQGRLYTRKGISHEWPEHLCSFYAKKDVPAPKEDFFSLAVQCQKNLWAWPIKSFLCPFFQNSAVPQTSNSGSTSIVRIFLNS